MLSLFSFSQDKNILEELFKKGYAEVSPVPNNNPPKSPSASNKRQHYPPLQSRTMELSNIPVVSPNKGNKNASHEGNRNGNYPSNYGGTG